jgi:hypothetical protein
MDQGSSAVQLLCLWMYDLAITRYPTLALEAKVHAEQRMKFVVFSRFSYQQQSMTIGNAVEQTPTSVECASDSHISRGTTSTHTRRLQSTISDGFESHLEHFIQPPPNCYESFDLLQ